MKVKWHKARLRCHCKATEEVSYSSAGDRVLPEGWAEIEHEAVCATCVATTRRAFRRFGKNKLEYDPASITVAKTKRLKDAIGRESLYVTVDGKAVKQPFLVYIGEASRYRSYGERRFRCSRGQLIRLRTFLGWVLKG